MPELLNDHSASDVLRFPVMPSLSSGTHVPSLTVALNRSEVTDEGARPEAAGKRREPTRATPQQVERLRTGLQTFLGDVTLEPNYEAKTLAAILTPTNEALALLAAGPGAAPCVKVVAGAGFEPATFGL